MGVNGKNKIIFAQPVQCSQLDVNDHKRNYGEYKKCKKIMTSLILVMRD